VRNKLTAIQSCAELVQWKLGKSLLILLVYKVRWSQKHSCTIYSKFEEFLLSEETSDKTEEKLFKNSVQKTFVLNKSKMYIGLPANGFINLLNKKTLAFVTFVQLYRK